MTRIQVLQSKGVVFLAPESSFVAEDVDPARIAAGVTIHPGCRLNGNALSIGPGCVIGAEAPATLTDCQLGAQVHLAGGFFEKSTFLDGFKAGSCAHVRPGCLFEEGSSIAHSVGVKQTVFLPWVTAGSLINFCDALMAGGTSRKNHSEIGSSYIHFNFTPHQDKATASLVGDVPQGVLLNSAPIFLGGQGGMVGPCRIGYGTIIPAGQVWRGDVTASGHLVAKAGFKRDLDMPYDTRTFSSVTRIVRNNLAYIGNMLALDSWYAVVRAAFMSRDLFQSACLAGARQRLDEILDERFSRLDELMLKVEHALACETATAKADEHRMVLDRWREIRPALRKSIDLRETAHVPSPAHEIVAGLPKVEYVREIQSLSSGDQQIFGTWLCWRVAAAEGLFPDPGKKGCGCGQSEQHGEVGGL